MISGIGFDTGVAASLGLARQKQAATATPDPLAARKAAADQAKADFLDYAHETPEQRMEDNWLRAHGLDRKKLAAMNDDDREKILKQMREDIEQSLKHQTEDKAHVDLLA